jgi:hypothetical protein
VLRVGGHSFSIVLICNGPITLSEPNKPVHSFEANFMQLMFWRVYKPKLNLRKKENGMRSVAWLNEATNHIVDCNTILVYHTYREI